MFFAKYTNFFKSFTLILSLIIGSIYYLLFLCGYLQYVQKRLIFENFNIFASSNLTDLSDYGFLYNEYVSSSIAIRGKETASIGVLTIFKRNASNLKDPNVATVAYIHGSKGDRKSHFRLELYKVLRYNYHVITFDYRGFGNTFHDDLSENSVVEDATHFINWVLNTTKSNQILIWGHSLGSAIATKSLININNHRIQKLILESPLYSLQKAISDHFLIKYLTYLPFFKYLVLDQIYDNDFRFETNKNIQNISVPILILHAKDDHSIHYQSSLKIYEEIKNVTDIKIILFDERFQFDHLGIFKFSKLLNIVNDFMNDELKQNFTYFE